MRACISLFVLTLAAMPADLRVGIVGTDTGHAINLTRAFNDSSDPAYVPGARVVAAYKGGSPDYPLSYQRVDQIATELQSKYGVEFVPDIPTLCKKVDAILLESVDGRVHLKQAKEIIAARKPMFIDKPLAATLEDAREIARLAAEAGVPWFSSTSPRFSPVTTSMKFADATDAISWAPCHLEELFPLDLSFYGIYSIEMLYTLMGTGCEEVRRIVGRDSDVIIGRWRGGRTGTVYALRTLKVPSGTSISGAVVFRPTTVVVGERKNEVNKSFDSAIVKFFQTGIPPVSNAETLEIFAFMDAAQRSKAAGGQPVRLR